MVSSIPALITKSGNMVTVEMAVSVQLFASVPVTVYWVVIEGEAVTVEPEEEEVPPVQK
jgi:hypothetical protein